VLLVEDDGNDVELIQRAFKTISPQVALDVAYTGREAVAYFMEPERARALPALILTDVNMPVMDGFEFLAWFKKHSPNRHTPVVMLSSSAMENDVARAYELGAAGYIVKPPTFEELSYSLEAVIRFSNVNQLPPPLTEEEFRQGCNSPSDLACS